MVKSEEMEVDSQVAKKQKTDASPSKPDPETITLEDGPEAASPKPEKKVLEPYQANLDQEEDEVKRRSETVDKKLFVNICESIEELMKGILNLKNSKEDNWSELVEEKKVQVLMLVLSLRRLSRVQKVRVKNERETSSESRQEVDTVTLQLQNLLYEVAYLKKEIKRCLDFHSGDEDISLVDLNSFYNEASDNITDVGNTLDNPHLQHVARLNWELEQRTRQTKMFEKLTSEKEALANLISEDERKLASLAPQIKSILEATTPLQQILGLNLDGEKEIQKTAQLLPIPLYALWVQVTAYAEACDHLVKAELKGNLEDARKIALSNDTSDTTDSEEMDTGDDSSSRKPHSKGKKSGSGSNKKKLFALHPLSVCITIIDKKRNKVVVNFHYAVNLRVVTTTCSIEPVENLKLHIENVLRRESFLECIQSNDYGISCPNPTGTYMLQQANLELSDHLATVGRPFKWAQVLCGLTFLTDDPTVAKGSIVPDEDSKDNSNDTTMTQRPKCKENISCELSAEHMGSIIKSIRNRLKARLLLHAQFANLLSSTLASFSGISLPADLLKLHFPPKITSVLNSWRPMIWSDYCSQPSTEIIRESGAVNNHFLLYKAIMEHKQARIDALVAVSPDHPRVTPVFSLNIHWKGHHNADKNPQDRHMESEVNDHWEELIVKDEDRFFILPLLLYRLLMCLDIYIEAHSAEIKEKADEDEGTDAPYPYKYNKEQGKFSHR